MMRFSPTGMLLLAVLTGHLPAGPAYAQNATGAFGKGHPKPFVAIARSDLMFGEVLPGIRSSVTSDDPRNAAMFEVQGAANGSVRIEFLLPTALVSQADARLPLTFSSRDGRVSPNRGRFQGVSFDPRRPLITTLGPSGKLYVKLGGTVEPSIDQSGGLYTATISITVIDLGT